MNGNPEVQKIYRKKQSKKDDQDKKQSVQRDRERLQKLRLWANLQTRES